MPTPEMLKKMKMDVSASLPVESVATTSRNGASVGQPRAATVEDVDEDMDGDFAPGGDADYFAEEDEEGRFYGGGLSKEQKEILNIFDKDVAEGAVEDVSDLYTSSADSCDVNLDRRNECYRGQKVIVTVRTCREEEPGPTIQISR